MLENILKTDKMQVSFDKENKYCRIILTHNGDEIDLFKTDLQLFLKQVEKYKPEKNIWDLSKFELIIDIDLQTWIDDNINNKEFLLGVKKEAFVMPQDLITQLSIEQTMEENSGKKIVSKYFDSYDQALKWLLD